VPLCRCPKDCHTQIHSGSNALQTTSIENESSRLSNIDPDDNPYADAVAKAAAAAAAATSSPAAPAKKEKAAEPWYWLRYLNGASVESGPNFVPPIASGAPRKVMIFPGTVSDGVAARSLVTDIKSIQVDAAGDRVDVDTNGPISTENENQANAVQALEILNNKKIYVEQIDTDYTSESDDETPLTAASAKKNNLDLKISHGCLVSASPSVVFSNSRFGRDQSPFSVSLVTGASTKVGKVEIKDRGSYDLAADWILGYYAANNDTYDAKKGDEVFGGAILHTVFYDVPEANGKKIDLQWIQFSPTYFAVDRTGNNATLTDHFDPVALDKGGFLPELDFESSLYYLWSFFSCYQKDHIPKVDPSVALTRLPRPPDPAAIPERCPIIQSSTKNDTGKPGYDSWPHLGFPTFKEDSTGVEGDIKITLESKDSEGTSPEFNPVPSLTVAGGKYLDHDYYNVKVSPQWTDKFATIDPLKGTNEKLTFGPDLSRQVALTGTTVKQTWSGALDFSIPEFGLYVSKVRSDHATPGKPAPDDDRWDYSNAFDLTTGVAATKNNAVGPTAVNTDEYSATAHLQQLMHFHELILDDNNKPYSCYIKNDSTVVPSTIDVESDLNEWVKPDESTQNSNFFTSVAGSFHTGGDIPVPVQYISGVDEAPEYIRGDLTFSGGGIFDVAPDTDRFYGGNTPSGTQATDLPSPTVRSFGTGKLGVYPDAGTKQAGTISFADTNFTLALPFPGLAFPFLDPDASKKVEGFIEPLNHNNQGIVDNLANRDELDYVANYEDKFAVHPLFTCDAAWLGGPSNYHDRSLVSVGGGAEFTLAIVNFDILYEGTLHDSAHQPHSENIIAQISYDIHF
jgi:hypothetical protein